MFYATDENSIRVFRRKRNMDRWLAEEPAAYRMPQKKAVWRMAERLSSDYEGATFDKPWKYVQYMTADEIVGEYFDAFGGDVE